jgi:SAM-dependent methyltransferase
MMNAGVQGELWSSDPQGWAEAAESRNRPPYERMLDGLDLLPATRYLVGDLERVPFGDGAFDVVTAFNSVLYAADPRRALIELARVTAPAGRAIVTVGAGPEQAESAALINPLAPHEEVPDGRALDLADADAARALLDAGFAWWRQPTSGSRSASTARTTRSTRSCPPDRSRPQSVTPATRPSTRRCGPSLRRAPGLMGPCAWASSSAAISRSGWEADQSGDGMP